MSGHPKVDCALRVQGNTLEWVAGRVLYLIGYMTDPSKRGPGFGIQALATLTLLIGSAAGAIGRMV